MPTFDLGRRASLAHGLKSARFRAQLRANQAAMMLTARGLSCQRGTLLAWERGRGTTSREPYASDLPVIAAVYGCTVSDLFAEAPIYRDGDRAAGAKFGSNGLIGAGANGIPIPPASPVIR